jgi:NDP-hexose 3,5-(Or5-) epimerase
MELHELAIRHSYRLVPQKIPDDRGYFAETVRLDELAGAVGHPFTLAQANVSVSRRNTLRGIHSVRIPPGQAKIVSCVRGAVLSLLLDVRIGSPTFGASAFTRLAAEDSCAVYVPAGVGHGFLALTEGACVTYLCSTYYQPGTPLTVNPLDPELDLPWGLRDEPIMSENDAKAPTLAEAQRLGQLPRYADCLAYYAALGEPAGNGGGPRCAS